jgi:hypothetical protein
MYAAKWSPLAFRLLRQLFAKTIHQCRCQMVGRCERLPALHVTLRILLHPALTGEVIYVIK